MIGTGEPCGAMAATPKRQRLFFGTLQKGSHTDESWRAILTGKMGVPPGWWLLGQEEMGESSSLSHFQFCVHTKNPRSVSVSSRIKIAEEVGAVGAHIEAAKGNLEQNIAYCTKEGSGGRIPNTDVVELGDRPKQGKRNDIHTLHNDVVEGKVTYEEILLEHPMLHARYKRHWEALEDNLSRKVYRKEMPKCIWLWGESGSGKSHLLFTKYAKLEWLSTGELYLFDLEVNKWWDGFNPRVCKTVGLNEFRGQVRFATLMAWCDKWPMTVPVRARQSVPLKFNTIVITSIFHPKDVYKKTLEEEGEPWAQFKRRFDVIHVNKPLMSKL